MQLYYEQLGNEDKTTLIFLHGLLGSGRNLRSLAKRFVADYRVILPDLRNHGKSPHDEGMNYVSMANDLSLLIQELNIKQATLIGHSMGGKVAMVSALQSIDLIDALVILDIAPVTYNSDLFQVIDNLLSIDLSMIRSRQDADHALAKIYPDTLFRHFLLQNLIQSAGQLQWRANLEILRDNMSDIDQFPDIGQYQFNKPTLFLGGKNSEYIQDKDQATIKHYFPMAEMQMLDDAGHWLHIDQPQIVYEKIQGFLAKQ